MEELFRFSVVRPTTRFDPNGISLQEAPPGPLVQNIAAGVPTFQQQLAATAQALVGAKTSNEVIWARLEPLALAFVTQSGAGIVGNVLWKEAREFIDALLALADPSSKTAVTAAAIQGAFAAPATLTAQAAGTYKDELSNLFIALLILRRGGPGKLQALVRQHGLVPPLVKLVSAHPTLPDIADRIRACQIAAAGAAPLTPVAPLAGAAFKGAFFTSVSASLLATTLVPPSIFAALEKPVLGVGFRELHVVRQNIRKYEPAEVSRIENVLIGEKRDHTQRHTLSTEQTSLLSQADSSETDKELTSNDRTDVKTEADSQIKTDTKVDAGVHAQYSAPSFKLQADLGVSYSNSRDDTKKYASEVAKEVTQKAVSKITSTVTRSQSNKVVETYDDREQQVFDNKSGKNVSGVYQWIEKTYLSQVFNLGRHMLVDLVVPEPGANLLAMATRTAALEPPPVQPRPLGSILADANGPVLDPYGRLQLQSALNPMDLSESALTAALQPNPNFYGLWISYYGATGVSPPPELEKTFSKPRSVDYEDDTDKAFSDQIQVDDGYEATQVRVSATAMRNDNPGGNEVFINVSIGGTTIHITWPNSQRSNTLVGAAALPTAASGMVTFTVYGREIDQMTVNVELVCRRQQSALDRWRLQTFEKIAAAYANLRQTYDTALAAQKIAAKSVGPLGAADPATNRLTERVELKRSCIAMLDDANATVSGKGAPIVMSGPLGNAATSTTQPNLPEIDLTKAQAYGDRVRWFEHAFEWENMAYVLYPYFWGRRESWVSGLTLANDDPTFLSFLRSGSARVVVPVRLGFEWAVQFYLNSGLPWLGGDLGAIGDEAQNPMYLDVAEELKSLTGGGTAGDLNEPIGDPWEYTIPTTLVQLRSDSSLPEWHRVPPAGASGAEWASDAPDGPWTWEDGAPP